MNTATKVTVEYIEDAEGFGTCAACDREGLRWLVHLTEGQPVGLECAKRVLGIKPAPKNYNWMDGFSLTAIHREYGQTWALYTHSTGRTALTLDGRPQQFGGADRTWEARGWAA